PTKVNPPGWPTCAQGFVPGDPYVTEYRNKLLNVIGQWLTDWLDGGTSDPDETAHIVETDANGLTSVAGLTVGKDTGGAALAATKGLRMPYGIPITSLQPDGMMGSHDLVTRRLG